MCSLIPYLGSGWKNGGGPGGGNPANWCGKRAPGNICKTMFTDAVLNHTARQVMSKQAATVQVASSHMAPAPSQLTLFCHLVNNID